jgi:DNA-binding GntR family transcriptional regulator
MVLLDAWFNQMAITTQSPRTKSCYEQLRRTILNGQLTAGSRLVEEKWAKCLGVHRSALREAVILLAHEGMLELGPRGGYFVPRHDRDAFDEVLEIRIALEVGALRVLELHRADRQPDLKPLRKTCDLMQQMYEADFEFGFVEADRRFHDQLVELSGNKRMSLVYRQAPLPLFPMTQQNDAERRENMERTLREHRQVCELLEEGRIDDAVVVLRRHLLMGHQKKSTQTAVPSVDEIIVNDGAALENSAHRS